MATILKRKGARGVTWQVKVRKTGQPTMTKSFRRKADAEAWAAEVERDARMGRLLSPEAERRTLRELIERYDREVLSTREGDAEDRRRQLAVWNDLIGRRLLIHVTPALLSEQRGILAAQGRAPATVNRYLGALSHAFTVAVNEWEWVEQNPLRKVRRMKEPRGRVRYLSDDERDRLLQAAKDNHDDRLYPLVVLALCTGRRQGELMALQWRHVDLDREQAMVVDTKNGLSYAIPLTGPALTLLKERHATRDRHNPWVFPPKRGTKGPTRFPHRQWNNVRAAANLDDFHFHDLRHTTASYLAMNGATLMEIADVLGHKTLQMVRRYAHLSDAHTRRVVAAMTEKIFGEDER